MLFQQQDDNLLAVDFGGGASLTLKLRSQDIDIATIRLLNHGTKQTDLVESRINMLEGRVKMQDLTEADFKAAMAELDELRKRPDQLSMMVDYVHAAVAGWTDYYADKKAAERNEIVQYTKENLQALGVKTLGRIIEALNERFRFEPSDEEKKALTNSQPSSPSGRTEFNSYPDITSN